MRYLGGKWKIRKWVVDKIKPFLFNSSRYIEPFCGSCAVASLASRELGIPVYASDNNRYLIALLKAFKEFGDCDEMWPQITRDRFIHIRENKELYDDYIIGWAGFSYSFGGRFFHSHRFNDQNDIDRRVKNNRIKMHKELRHVNISLMDYDEVEIKKTDVVYCDPPYKNKSGYSGEFNHAKFNEWVRVKSNICPILVSEYEFNLDEFICIGEKKNRFQ